MTHLSEENHTLWRQGPRGLFQDVTAQAGLVQPKWKGTGFGTLLVDFEHERRARFGHCQRRVSARTVVEDHSLGPFWSNYGDRNQLFRGDGKGRFEDISLSNDPFCGKFNVARGLVRGDFDGDGAEDRTRNDHCWFGAPFYRNVAPKTGHWLKVRALDAELNRDAYDAEVRVHAGGRTFTAWLNPAESYICSSEPIAHFGLGAVDKVDSLQVHWPDRNHVWEEFDGCGVDQFIEIKKGKGRIPKR